MTTHPGPERVAPVPPEDVPDGTFGHARDRLPAHITPCPADEQADHLAELAAAIADFPVGVAIRNYRARAEGVPHGK